MKDTYILKRSTTINASPDEVYAHLVDLHRWEAWSPWEDLDPDQQKDFSGPDSGPGAKVDWTGNRKVGQGSMEITRVTEPSNVTIDLEFIKPFKASNKTQFDLRPEGEGTEVTWTMTGELDLMTRIMGIVKSMESMVGPDFERGLGQLKAAVEAPND